MKIRESNAEVVKAEENNAQMVKRERDKFKVGKCYSISRSVKKVGTVVTIVRCIKKYRNYALFDVLDIKGNRLYTTTLGYIDDSYSSREVDRFNGIDRKSKW